MTTSRGVTAVGALADPVRWSLYQYIAGRHDAVSREEAATAVGISLSNAKFHLDRLEHEGLVEVEHRRLTGRTGPGAGRPAKLYRRSSREVHVSLPERRYDVVGSILAAAVEQVSAGGDLESSIRAAAYARGVTDAERVCSSQPEDPSQQPAEKFLETEQVLARLGYEPEQHPRGLVLHNCPFDALAENHRELVCPMNQQYVQGILDGVGAENLESCLAPTPGYCCVVAQPSK